MVIPEPTTQFMEVMLTATVLQSVFTPANIPTQPELINFEVFVNT